MVRRRLVMRAGAPLLRGSLVGGTAYATGRRAAQLGQLAQLHQQGLLSEHEFEAAKARLLSPGYRP
jgi:hypothetical protein